MDPFKDVQTIIGWLRKQGPNWHDALGALLDLMQFAYKQVPAPGAAAAAHLSVNPVHAGLSPAGLAERLELEAAAYRQDPAGFNWQNLLGVLAVILRYIMVGA